MRYKILVVGGALIGSTALLAGEIDNDSDRKDKEQADTESVIDLRDRQLEDSNFRTCAGFLTRDESEQYCEEEVPDDWREFEFNGEKYYLQPLS